MSKALLKTKYGIPNLCQFLFGENMVMAFINPLSTYYGYEETVEQTHQNNS